VTDTNVDGNLAVSVAARREFIAEGVEFSALSNDVC